MNSPGGPVNGAEVRDTTDMELEQIKPEEDGVKLPLHEDIMQLAMLGEIGPIQKLLEDGRYDIKHKDEEGITPLHWAAINNHYALCKYLIEKGAEVNIKGGESSATPAMWAAQRCHYYVVNLFLQNGADPLVTDSQGYNILHLATFDGNVYLLILLLQQNISLDAPDSQGHTCLMWAAYKGFPAVVDLFLRWGANINSVDEEGFTALHWALVKGNPPCIQKLVEYGCDRYAETNSHKTPAITAEEMGSTGPWHRALKECGFEDDGSQKQFPLPGVSFIKTRSFLNRFFFLFPFLLLVVVFLILSRMVIYAAVPIAFFLAYTLQFLVQKVLIWAPTDMKHIHKTPYLAGVFAATLFLVGLRWLTHILPTTYGSNPFSNLAFIIAYGFCTYFYTVSMTEDPGYVPKSASRSQQKSTVEELLALWKYDEHNFCVHCMVRMPLRGKHCRRCARCVAKHDHHCPWVHNCVGANNHRHFFLYITALEMGILLFVFLTWKHLENFPLAPRSKCNVLSDVVCGIVLRDTYTVVLAVFSSLQLIWVSMLMIVQLIQIARAVTTYESMRGNLHHTSQFSEAVTSMMISGTTSMSGAQITNTGMGPDPAVPGRRPRRKEGFFAQWKKLLGLDTFFATAQGTAGSRKRGNPFSRGIVTNCKDFWCDPAPYFGRRETGAAMLGGEVVNYTRMYETPPRMKHRRPRQERDAGMYHSVRSDDVV